MSSYTHELREICANLIGIPVDETVSGNIDEVIELANGHIFDFTYPIFDEDYRAILEKKIVSHFYMREIAFETYGLWKMYLRNTLNEIMPYYNQLYESVGLIKDPLASTDYVRTNNSRYNDKGNTVGNDTSTRTGHTKSEEKRNENNVNRDLYADTPQGSLNGLDSGQYLTNARKVSEEGKQVTAAEANITDTETNVNNVTENKDGTRNDLINVKGNMGFKSKSQLLKEYRDTFLNIDMRIIAELETLFLQIW